MYYVCIYLFLYIFIYAILYAFAYIYMIVKRAYLYCPGNTSYGLFFPGNPADQFTDSNIADSAVRCSEKFWSSLFFCPE